MLKIITKDADIKLVEMVDGMERQTAGWRAIHFHFSKLLDHYKSDYQMKIATNLISDLLKEKEGTVFICPNFDIVVLAKGVQRSVLDKMIFQLRYLYVDDPLAYISDGRENLEFSHVYDLSVEWEEFRKICKKKMSAQARADALASFNSQDIKPLTPARLVNIERDLLPADLTRVIRKQAICAIAGGQVRRVFDELYINIAHLRQILMSEADLTSNRWLFKYITQLLDDKVLTLLRHNPHRYFDMPVSVNLNVSTLLSEKFVEFDEIIKPSMKVSLVLELQLADVFADMDMFLLAKRTVQKMGYRICLDGLTSKSLQQIDRERLGFDLAKLQWGADVSNDVESPEHEALVKAVERCGANRIILCRCDNSDAIGYGQALGIGLFQGRHLDRLLNPNAKVEN